VKRVRLHSVAYDSQILKRLSSIADDFSPADVATCLGNASDAEVLGMLALGVPPDSAVHFTRGQKHRCSRTPPMSTISGLCT
jgi:hypothetical protein